MKTVTELLELLENEHASLVRLGTHNINDINDKWDLIVSQSLLLMRKSMLCFLYALISGVYGRIQMHSGETATVLVTRLCLLRNVVCVAMNVAALLTVYKEVRTNVQ